jgi:hypothetical protein
MSETAPKKTRRQRGTIDWAAIEHDFVTGGDDVRQVDLAAKYGIDRRTVSRRAVANEWTRKRVAHREDVMRTSHELVADQKAGKLAEWADKRLDKLQAAFMEAIGDLTKVEPGSAKMAQATVVGILLDKLHKELDRAGVGPAEGVTYTKATLSLEQWRNLDESAITDGAYGAGG